MTLKLALRNKPGQREEADLIHRHPKRLRCPQVRACSPGDPFPFFLFSRSSADIRSGLMAKDYRLQEKCYAALQRSKVNPGAPSAFPRCRLEQGCSLRLSQEANTNKGASLLRDVLGE